MPHLAALLLGTWRNLRAVLRDERGGGQPTPFVNAFDHPQVNSLRYNTSQQGSPVPIVLGTQRVTINLIEYWGFKSSGSSSAKGGGKGLGNTGGKKGSGTQYSVDVAWALCEGPIFLTGSRYAISGQNRVWVNGIGVSATDGRLGSLNYYLGADGQAADPVFASSDPNTPVVNYSGTAYVTGTPIDLGSSPALPDFSVEVSGFGAGTAGPSYGGDIRPDNIVSYLLTDSRFGIGFPSANLDLAGSIADWGVFCQAAEMAMSLILDRQQPVGRWIQEITDLTTAAVFWSGSKLKIVPYDCGSYSGNGATWTANTTAQYALLDRDYAEDAGGAAGPVEIDVPDIALAPNWLALECMDASIGYNPIVVSAFEQGLIDRYGLRTDPVTQAHEFTAPGPAYAAAKRMLQKKAYVRQKYTFRLGARFSRLELMDIVTLTDSYLGLSGFPVRITQIDEDDNGELTLVGEELMNSPTITLAVQPSTGQPLDFLADPGNANDPIIFEPLRALSGGQLEVWLITSGGADWGGAEVFISTDGTSYTAAGRIYKGARQGVLTAILPSHADPDTTDTLSVDLTESLGTLLSGTAADADNFVTLCYVDGELISYETATLTAANKYDLTTRLRRGVYGTTVGSHAIGTKFARFGPTDSNTIFRYTYPSSYVGQTIHVKLVSFNLFGQALQDISSVTDYTYTLTGAGALGSINVQVSYPGASPPSGTAITLFTAPQAISFGANLVDSVVKAAVAATVSTDFNVNRNGVTFATMTFAAGATSATFSGSNENFVAGDVLEVVPTRTDATLAGISGYLAGSG